MIGVVNNATGGFGCRVLATTLATDINFLSDAK
jgi:hypothetical protein